MLGLQRLAGNRAVSAALTQVSREKPGGTVAPPETGAAVDKLGVIDQDGRWAKGGSPGLTLRAGPTTAAADLGRLRHGKDHVFAKQDAGQGWLYAAVIDGPLKGRTGYVFGKDPAGVHDHVNTDMPPDPSAPDAGAQLHTVAEGEQAQVFVRNHYGAVTQEKGQDERFFTNVLLHINQLAKRGGVYTEKVVRQKPGLPVPTEIEEVWLKTGSTIWVPSLDFALSLKGKVSAGSWARDAWEAVKGFAEKAAGVAAFIAGLVVGGVESIKDIFVGTLEFLWDTLKSLGGNLVDAARAIYDLVSDPKKRQALLDALGDKLSSMWEAPGFLRRWYNRGWLIGYATMEVVATLVLPGVAAALKASKFAGRASKFLKVVGSTKIGSAVASTTRKVAAATKAATGGIGGLITKSIDAAATAGRAGSAIVSSVKGLGHWLGKRFAGQGATKRLPHVVTGAQSLKALAAAFGYPALKLVRLMRFARKHKVRLWLRKSNRHSPLRLAEGAIPKPMDIKARTINEWDLFLNKDLSQKQLGLAGYFKPDLPAKRPQGVSRRDWRKVKARAKERATEYGKLADEMKRLETAKAPGDVLYRVERGVVKQVDTETGDVFDLAGDVDLFQITKADGSPLSPAEYDKVVTLLVEKDLIEHGAHAWWKTRRDYDPDTYRRIVKQHETEPLVEIGVTNEIREVVGSQVPGL